MQQITALNCHPRNPLAFSREGRSAGVLHLLDLLQCGSYPCIESGTKRIDNLNVYIGTD